jgi:hypothetical protein
MNDSMAQREHALAPAAPAGWRNAAGWTGAILISLLFLVSGMWKVLDAPAAAVRMKQALVPEVLSLPTAIGFGVVEVFAAILIVIPSYRRWGAWITSLLLVAFLVYFAVLYNALQGEECNCFPWVERAVGPAFFIGDAIMLALALAAGYWARPSTGSIRKASALLAGIGVFALASYGVAVARQSGTPAPQSIMVDGAAHSLERGKVLIYFFDPECLSCLHSGQRMAEYKWADTRVIVAPTRLEQFAPQFLADTGLKAGITSDAALLRQSFPFVDVPAAVAIEDGRQKALLLQFEGGQFPAELRKLGFIHE